MSTIGTCLLHLLHSPCHVVFSQRRFPSIGKTPGGMSRQAGVCAMAGLRRVASPRATAQNPLFFPDRFDNWHEMGGGRGGYPVNITDGTPPRKKSKVD